MHVRQSKFPLFFPALLALALLVVFTACDSTPGAMDDTSPEGTTVDGEPTAKRQPPNSVATQQCGIPDVSGRIADFLRNPQEVPDHLVWDLRGAADPTTVSNLGGNITLESFTSPISGTVWTIIPEANRDDNVIIIGSEGDDVLRTRRGDDCIFGLGGNDNIHAGNGSNLVRGGDGNDRLVMTGDGSKESRLSGEAGDDELKVFQRGIVVMIGGDGNDKLYGAAGPDYLYGGDGDDYLQGDQGPDVSNYPHGDDFLYGQAGDDILKGQGGNDRANGGPGTDEVYGGEGNDFLTGSDGNDKLYGEAGNDRLRGSDGEDLLYSGDGNDRLTGGDGNDELYGEAGNDRLEGNGGADKLFAGEGDDDLFLDADDLMAITNGNRTFEWIDGSDGYDYARTNDSGTGGVTLNMGKARLERFRGGNGDDKVAANGVLVPVKLNGGGGNDWLAGSIRNDLIIGGPGDDRLGGNKGEDVLIAGPGADRMGGSAHLGTRPDQLQLSTGDLVSNKLEEVGLLEGDQIMFRRANWTIVDAKVVRNEDIFITVKSDKGDNGTIRLLDLALLATSSDDLTKAADMQAFLSQFVTHKVSFDSSFALV